MDLISHFTQSSLKKNIPDLRPGDTVRVHQRIREGNKERIQVFEGTVIAVRGGKSINSSFVVRRIASGVGVEKTFPLHSPNVVKVERLKSSKVRQARLFYLRERFGRAMRMTKETRNQTGWEEGQEEPVADLAAEDSQTTEEANMEVADSPETDVAINEEETQEDSKADSEAETTEEPQEDKA